MTFFNKKQDVIDIKLTQFGKNLLARGFFRPAFYKFFDDDILYNSECAGFKEEQNRAEERILESQRPRTQHSSVGVESLFDHQENMINSGSSRTFMEINRRQDPLISDKLLKYPLQDTLINSPKMPAFKLLFRNVTGSSMQSFINAKGINLPVPQINLTSSYTLERNEVNRIPENEILDEVRDSQNYFDLTSERIEFLDKTFLDVEKQEILINLEELNADSVLENFEIEFYEIDESSGKEILKKITSKEEVEKFFNITIDEDIKVENMLDLRNSKFHRREEE